MSDVVLTTLLAKGVKFFWDGHNLTIEANKGVLSTQEREWIRENKLAIGQYLEAQKVHKNDTQREHGRQLLHALWDCGYSLTLERSTANPGGYVLIPLGDASPPADLLALYDAHHQAAVALLVEACDTLGLDPLRWHEVAAEFETRKIEATRAACQISGQLRKEHDMAARKVCRCGSTKYREFRIHGGKTVRRDCAVCGRFLGFPAWHGEKIEDLDKPKQAELPLEIQWHCEIDDADMPGEVWSFRFRTKDNERTAT